MLAAELGYRDTDREVLESGIAKFDDVHTLPLVDGRNVVVRSQRMRYQDADGNVIGLLIAFQELEPGTGQDDQTSCP